MANETQTPACSQEPRLSILEHTQEQILETLKDLKNLLATTIRTEERLSVASKRQANLEQRMADLEKRVYSGAWVERVLFTAIAAGIGWWIRSGIQ